MLKEDVKKLSDAQYILKKQRVTSDFFLQKQANSVVAIVATSLEKMYNELGHLKSEKAEAFDAIEALIQRDVPDFLESSNNRKLTVHRVISLYNAGAL